MTDFLKREMTRLVDLLPETDPTSADYQMLLRSIECLDAMGATVDGILIEAAEDNSRPEPDPGKIVPFTGANKVQPEEAAEPETQADPMDEAVKRTTVAENATTVPTTEAKTYSSSDVRKALVDARGRGVDVKTVLAAVGADNFAAVPQNKYGALMAQLEVM